MKATTVVWAIAAIMAVVVASLTTAIIAVASGVLHPWALAVATTTVVGLAVGLKWITKPGRLPMRISRLVQDELMADSDVDFEVVDGRLVGRMGVCRRLALEVKGRFGGTPKLTEDNRLLAARYIMDAMEQHGAIRKSDMVRLMFRTRALVFIPFDEEIEELQMAHTSAARHNVTEYSSWKQRWTSM